MRCISTILLIFLSFILPNLLRAQVDTLNILGLGISLSPRTTQIIYIRSSLESYQARLTNVSTIVFYLPINVTNEYRLEPSFGIFSTGNKNTETSSPQSATTDEASIIDIGIRGTYISSLSNSLAFYFGPSIDFSFVSSKYENWYLSNYPSPNTVNDYKTTSTETDLTVGAVVGAEYFPIRKFSVGGEINLNYVTYGNPNITNEVYPTPTYSTINTNKREQYTIYTGTLFFLRWYFL